MEDIESETAETADSVLPGFESVRAVLRLLCVRLVVLELQPLHGLIDVSLSLLERSPKGRVRLLLDNVQRVFEFADDYYYKNHQIKSNQILV